MGTPRRGVRRARIGKRARASTDLWPQAARAGLPRCRAPVAARTVHRAPTDHRLAAERVFVRKTWLYLPTDYAGADEIIRAADLAMVYGGHDVVAKYAADPTVLVNGPGRSKILITAEQDWRDHLDVIVDSISALGGMACVNATAVLYEGDPVAAGCRPIAERLVGPSLRCRPPTNRPCCPPCPSPAAQCHRRLPRATCRGTTPRCSAPIRWSPTSATATAALRPAVHLLAAARSRQAQVELAFPCVWVSPWSRDDGLGTAAPLAGGQRDHRRRGPDR